MKFVVSLVRAGTLLLVLPLHAIADNVDCRSCHVVGGIGSAVDLSPIYAEPTKHHQVGIAFPVANENYRAPQDQAGDVVFFDKNANGQPDINEVQLFGLGQDARMSCSTCHAEHGTTPAPQLKLPMYLRVDNSRSALCSTCHLQ
jgi:hypothetical protein